MALLTRNKNRMVLTATYLKQLMLIHGDFSPGTIALMDIIIQSIVDEQACIKCCRCMAMVSVDSGIPKGWIAKWNEITNEAYWLCDNCSKGVDI